MSTDWCSICGSATDEGIDLCQICEEILASYRDYIKGINGQQS